MSSIEVKEIVYHCECRRFILGTTLGACYCHECGREHAPTDIGAVHTASAGL